jgi:flagellar biosynthesis protein FliQ
VTPTDAIDVARDAIFVVLQVAAPIMLAALVVGLFISLFQALTQIQEMTLAFVPKILVIFVATLLLLPFMFATMNGLMERIVDRIVTVG